MDKHPHHIFNWNKREVELSTDSKGYVEYKLKHPIKNFKMIGDTKFEDKMKFIVCESRKENDTIKADCFRVKKHMNLDVRNFPYSEIERCSLGDKVKLNLEF